MGATAKCPGCGEPIPEGLEFCNRCGLRVGEGPDDPLLGRTIADKYLIRELLGSGAMGRIYTAEHTALERTVALKVLHPHLAYNEAVVHRFLREARAASRLAHPNIVTLLDFGQDPDDGLLYLVMEFLEGRALQRIIEQESPLDLPRVLDLALQILLAMDEAHAQGIVHRDLKPENIIVVQTRRGEQVKVVDFGLAQVVGTDDPRLTSTGFVCGTPSYISPEQARATDVSHLTDIYSFGVVLYEMVTGLLPFDASGAYEMVSKHLTEQPPSPAERAPERPVPEALSAIVMRCLEKSPTQRIGAAVEIHDALEAVRLSLAPGPPAHRAPTPAPDARTCPSCGGAMPAHARFCGACGADMTLDATVRTDAPPPSPPAAEESDSVVLDRLRKFVPQGVLDALAQGVDLLASQRRQVVVLFAEVVGLSSAVTDPEDALRVIDRCFDALTQTVERHGGSVDRFIGDCLMGIFGAPVTHEDDPERALQAAFDMRETLERINSTLPFALSLRIGINAGVVVAGPVGGPGRLDYAVVGETVRLAQLIEGAAEPGRVLATDEIYRACVRSFRFKPRPSVRIENRGERVAVFEVMGPAPADDQPAPATPATFLLGRSRERTDIEAAARHAREGTGAALLITGEAGSGKSALMLDAAERLGPLGFDTHVVRARRGIGGAGVFGQLIRSMLGCPPDATEGQVRGRLATREGLDETDRAALAFLALASRSSASLPAMAQDLTCVTAMRRMLRHTASVRPLAVLIDDLRHIGERERHLLEQLVATVLEHPTLLLVSSREKQPSFIDAGFQPLELGPLHPAAAERLLRQLAGERHVDDETAQRVVEASGGNPLYLVEMVGHLEREGTLAGDAPRRRRRRVTRVPGNLRALVTARFDNLELQTRNVLMHAALIGREFTPALLTRLMSDRRGLQTALEELVDQGLLESSGDDSASPRLHFRHDVVREILCNTITRDNAREIHGRIADLLLDGADPDATPAEIGRQLEQAGRDSEAVGQYELAAGDRRDRGEPAGAARYMRLAVQALERSDAGNPGSPRAIELQIQLARFLNRATEWEEARGVALRARNLALPTGDVILAAQASHELARAAAELGDLPLADSVLAEAYQTAFECGELNLAAALASDLGEVQERRGQLDQALATLEGAHSRLESASRRSRVSQAGAASGRVAEVLNRLGRVMLRMGRAEEAIGYLGKGLTHARVAGDPVLEGRVLGNLGQAQANSGDLSAARDTFDDALRLLQRAGDRVGTAKLLHNLARLHLDRGERDEAQALARESFDLSVEIGWREGEALGAAFLEQVG